MCHISINNLTKGRNSRLSSDVGRYLGISAIVARNLVVILFVSCSVDFVLMGCIYFLFQKKTECMKLKGVRGRRRDRKVSQKILLRKQNDNYIALKITFLFVL